MKKELLKEIIRDFHVNPLPPVVERDISIITSDEAGEFEAEGIKIKQVPLYKWLLE